MTYITRNPKVSYSIKPNSNFDTPEKHKKIMNLQIKMYFYTVFYMTLNKKFIRSFLKIPDNKSIINSRGKHRKINRTK